MTKMYGATSAVLRQATWGPALEVTERPVLRLTASGRRRLCAA